MLVMFQGFFLSNIHEITFFVMLFFCYFLIFYTKKQNNYK